MVVFRKDSLQSVEFAAINPNRVNYQPNQGEEPESTKDHTDDQVSTNPGFTRLTKVSVREWPEKRFAVENIDEVDDTEKQRAASQCSSKHIERRLDGWEHCL